MSGTFPDAPRSEVGLSIYSCGIHAKDARDGGLPFADPGRFLDFARSRGAGGIQVPIGQRPRGYLLDLRRRAEADGMYVEGEASLPRSDADAARFEAELAAARDAGATVVRVAAGGRRYEDFAEEGPYREFAARAEASLRVAAPIAERAGVDLAIENHKDFRVPQLLEMIRRLGSARIGVCVDVGNGLALLEDPMEVVEACAPLARAVHLKDAVLAPCADGFLLGDVPLGEGILDLPAMVRALRRARPAIRFTLEMITRDPLRIPCLGDRYWATLRDVPARDLARTLGLVKASAGKPVPRASDLPAADRVAREDENIRRSLAYAREHLEL